MDRFTILVAALCCARQNVLGSLTTLATLGYVLGDLPHSPAAYMTGLTIDLFTVVFGYVNALDVIMQQTE